jgi:hypothetical protein
MNEFVLALVRGTRQGARYVRVMRGWRRFAILLAVLMVLAAAGGEILFFWRAWTTGVWGNLLLDTTPLLQLLIFPVKGVRFLRSAAKERMAREAAEKLRVAAAQGDEQLAPMTTNQPEVVDEANVSMTDIGPLRNPGASEAWPLVAFSVLATVIAAVVGAFAVLLLVLTHTDGSRIDLLSTEELLALALGIVALMLFGMAAHLAIWAVRLRRRLWLTADGRGIWRRGHDGKPSADGVMWSEARAFYWVALASVKAGPVFVLDGGEQMLVWSPGHSGQGETQAAHRRLCRLIATDTALSLRNLTHTVASLEMPAPTKQGKIHARTAMGGTDANRAPQISSLPAWGAIQRANGVKSIALMILIAMPIFYGLVWCAEHVQEWQFQQLARQIAVEHPIFADGLRKDDKLWPVGAPTENALTTADFASGVYQISGQYLASAPAPGVYGSVAVEVTARLVSKTSEYDGVGLLLRYGPDQISGVTFTVNQRGEWSISHWGTDSHDPNAAYGQQNGAIRKGDGAANTLMVLMRGKQYICYVNGQFVGSYYYDGDTTGRVALFEDGGSGTTGVFTDFRVLPGV